MHRCTRYITWCEKSEEQLEQEKKDKKKNKMIRDDEELTQMYVSQQIEKAKAEAGSDEEAEATELIKADNETVKLDLKMKTTLLANKADTKVGVKSVFKEEKRKEKEGERRKEESKRKMSALEEIMEQGKKQARLEEAKKPKVNRVINEFYFNLIIIIIIIISLKTKSPPPPRRGRG